MKQSRAWWQERSKIFLTECARLVEAAIGAEAVEAVFVCGSFASGEETIVLDTEPPVLLSDVDLGVVVKSARDLGAWYGRRAELGSACETALPEIRFSGHVELGVMLTEDLRRLPARPGVLDMKVRGRVLRGNERILDFIPEHPASDITRREALLVVENRAVALLDVAPGRPPLGGDESLRFAYELARAYTDIAAAAVSLAGCYVAGYIARSELIRNKVERERHSSLSTLVPGDVLKKIESWTRFKIDPARSEAERLTDADSREKVWSEAAGDVLRFWRRGMSYRGDLARGATEAVPAGALAPVSRDYRNWRGNLIGWRAFLSRYPLSRRVMLTVSTGKDLLGASPLDVVREQGLRLLEVRRSLGSKAKVKGCRFGFPHHGGPIEGASAEVSSLWREIVFGRRGDRT